jgi:hypothetical protein
MRSILVAFCLTMLFGSCDDQEIVGIPPNAYELKQNQPNPFSDTTYIEYGIPSVGKNPPRIRVTVYNRYQDRVVILRDSSKHPAGVFALTWKPYNTCSAGLYYIELQEVDIFGGGEVLKRIAAIKR